MTKVFKSLLCNVLCTSTEDPDTSKTPSYLSECIPYPAAQPPPQSPMPVDGRPTVELFELPDGATSHDQDTGPHQHRSRIPLLIA